MKKNIKRLVAFLLDLLIIGIVLMLIYYFIPINDTSEISKNITSLTEKVLNKEIGHIDYLNGFSENIYKLDYSRAIYTALNTVIIMFYFIIIPLITKGYTFGLYISGLKIDGKINVKNLIVRNLVATGLIYLILSIVLVYLTNNTLYFILLSILGIIQFLLVIISFFMVIYRHDEKGLQDILSKTKIIEVKK